MLPAPGEGVGPGGIEGGAAGGAAGGDGVGDGEGAGGGVVDEDGLAAAVDVGLVEDVAVDVPAEARIRGEARLAEVEGCGADVDEGLVGGGEGVALLHEVGVT